MPRNVRWWIRVLATLTATSLLVIGISLPAQASKNQPNYLLPPTQALATPQTANIAVNCPSSPVGNPAYFCFFGEGVKNCPFEYLCLWTDNDYRGWAIGIYTCGYHFLQNLPLPDGSTLKNKVTSLENNQTRGTVSHFYDDRGAEPDRWLGQQHAPGHRQNLIIDGWNDVIDYVLVC